jgi:Fe-S oxidoreductase
MCGICDRTAGAHAGEDWSEALAAAGFDGPFYPERLPGPVLVHEPCTARYGPAGGTPVAALLRRAGVDARSFASPACCGGAAPFALEAPAESAELGRRAAEAAAALGAASFVTSDAGCLLQFATSFGERGPRALHAAAALRLVTDPAYSPAP